MCVGAPIAAQVRNNVFHGLVSHCFMPPQPITRCSLAARVACRIDMIVVIDQTVCEPRVMLPSIRFFLHRRSSTASNVHNVYNQLLRSILGEEEQDDDIDRSAIDI